MKQAKDNKGISLVTLIITIIIMFIIAGITISTGTKQINTANEKKLLSELQIVKQAVYEKYELYNKTKNEDVLIGSKMSEEEAQALASNIGVTLITIPDSYKEKEKAYYRLTPTVIEKIGIKDAEDTYVVNYVTGEVINETKKTTNSGEVLYTYSRSVFDNEDVTAF